MIVKNVEKKENNAAVFQVETSAAEFESAVNGAYLKNKSSIYIPGFRKGKAPRTVVEGMYGKEVFYQDAMDELAPKAFDQGLSESGLRIVGAPAIEDVQVTDDVTVVYSFAVTLYPEVSLGQYKGLEAEKDVKQVSDEEVEKELEDLRRRNARMLSVDDREARMGDTAVIDFDGFLDGERFDGGKAEDYSLELGSNVFIPGFEEQVAGMKLGEEKDLNLTFPQEYAEELAGKDVVFKVTLKSLTVPELPELDDEFAKDVSEFDTLEAYKDDLRKNLQARYDEQAEGKFRTEIMRKACENMSVELPEVMVSDKMEEMLRGYAANFGMTDRNMSLEDLMQMMGLDKDSMNENLRPGAELQVKSELLLEAIIKAEDIQVSEEEAEEYLNKVAESINAKPEDVKSYFGPDFVNSERKKEKASALIFDSAVALAPAEEKAE